MLKEDEHNTQDLRTSEYNAYIAEIKKKQGVQFLTDDDLAALAFDEISHTFTREEKNYV